MGLKESIDKFFNNHSETKDKHWDKQLQTRYFKTTKDKAFKIVEDYFKSTPKCEIIAVSNERGEISCNLKSGKKVFITATIIMVKPFRTAVDFSVTTESVLPFDLGYSHRLIPKLYADLKKEMTLVD